ncbi:hypothetical protein, partial [Acidithiobacillus sp.]|uniref:hypothetical protein n=1 Tax=Acidithiobacillus sp. TaxID=1872118 RepID=UPI0031FF1A64
EILTFQSGGRVRHGVPLYQWHDSDDHHALGEIWGSKQRKEAASGDNWQCMESCIMLFLVLLVAGRCCRLLASDRLLITRSAVRACPGEPKELGT